MIANDYNNPSSSSQSTSQATPQSVLQDHTNSYTQQSQIQSQSTFPQQPQSDNDNSTFDQQQPQSLRASVKHNEPSTGMIIASKSLDEETEDGRVRNREAVTKIRDAWIYKQIQARQDEFTTYKQGRLFMGTWNVNAKGKDENDLNDWICSDWGPHGEQAPDIVAVGFQEMVDLNAVNVAVDNKSQQRAQFWLDRIKQTINNKTYTSNEPLKKYEYLLHKHLVGLLICVFVKAQHVNRVKYKHSDSVGVGVMGMMGNKGGVCVRFQFYDSTICLVCSHLAAHRENVAGRNSDFQNVLQKASFDIGDEAVKEVIRSGSLNQWATGTSSVGISDHDLVFWMGDLNYRVDESIPTERVIKLSEAGDLDELLRNDQLNLERAAGRVFSGFEEGSIHFRPTYKYQPGTDEYDQRPDKKVRAPAWCDRVLWMAKEKSHVVQLSYKRSELNISDHKPVMSTFVVTVKDVIQEKREQVYEEVMKKLDKFENQTLPMVGLDRLNLDFGEVRYDQTVTLPIKVTNTGKVVAHFRLVPKLDEQVLTKPWMTVSPTYGTLIPGDAEAVIHFSITINNETAHNLNTGRGVLEDILILRLENGRDYYITISATYARSCFAMSVDELVMYAEPIRNVPLDPIKRAETQEANPSAALCVPKELWRIIDAIYSKGGMTEKDIFSTPGNGDEVFEIREALDTGDPFPDVQIHSLCEVMLSFLSNLASPIVPPTLFPTLEVPNAQNIQSYARKFLEELPPIHYNVFVYCISFFRECLLYKETNKLSANKLSRICCNCFVMGNNVGSGAGGGNNEEDANALLSRRSGMQLIMMHFLETNSI